MRKTLTGKLVKLWNKCATKNWPWFEPSVTYDNARMCQALILSGQWMPHKEALEIGLKSLRRLAVSDPLVAMASTSVAAHARTSTSNRSKPRQWSPPAMKPFAPPRMRRGQLRPNVPLSGSWAATTLVCRSMTSALEAAVMAFIRIG